MTDDDEDVTPAGKNRRYKVETKPTPVFLTDPRSYAATERKLIEGFIGEPDGALIVDEMLK